MDRQRAMMVAPLAIYPVALVFIAVRSAMLSDPRELLVSPITAAAVFLIGFPMAATCLWFGERLWQQRTNSRCLAFVVMGFVMAEVCFWALVSPFWQRDFSALFCAGLSGLSGVATAWLYLRFADGIASHK
jgi:hypothetical protein